MSSPVGLILVSHSAALAAGVAELAGQMAPDVPIEPVGGDADGGLGTSFDAVAAALGRVGPSGAVLLYDLGSALLTAQSALEFAAPDVAARVRILDMPLVSGAVAAAVAAAGGADLAAVVNAALGTGDPDSGGSGGPEIRVTVTLVNDLGLHARPAAAIIRTLQVWEAQVSIGRPGQVPADARAILRVIRLALRGGESVEVSGTGPEAEPAVHAVSDLIATGFGERRVGPARITPTAMGAAPARMGNASVRVTAPPTPAWPRLRRGRLSAQAGAPGLAMGPLIKLDRAPLHISASELAASDPEQEKRHLATAIRGAGRRLAAGNEFQVAHAALLADPELRRQAERRLDAEPVTAADAWWQAVQTQADELAAEPDELVASRAVDVREAGAAVLAELGARADRIPVSLSGAVVYAADLGPGEVPVLLERGACGLVLSRASVTAHAVIVARGLGLPLVVRAGEDLARVAPGTRVVVDGDTGLVVVEPVDGDADEFTARIRAQQEAARTRAFAAAGPVTLPDGREVSVMANVGSLADAHAALRFGADGIGLLRTELLVLDRDTYPDEDTQAQELAEILDLFGERPVRVRVLDAGGDKPVTALPLDLQHNGFLGVRGLRYLLAHPDVLRTQLRAIFRAALGHRVSVMAPMVTIASEVVAFRRIIGEVVDALREAGIPFAIPEGIGVMIEVPAAALAADEICAVSDFVSVGSNDLTSYVMAADRTLPDVADLLDPAALAVQRALAMTLDQARAAGTPVAVCGEIAGMAEFAPRLVADGVSELSMAPARIPAIKELLRAEG